MPGGFTCPRCCGYSWGHVNPKLCRGRGQRLRQVTKQNTLCPSLHGAAVPSLTIQEEQLYEYLSVLTEATS